jgi:putative ABC transport system ATP-binding protein
MSAAAPLVTVEQVERVFRTGEAEVRALRGVSLTLYAGRLVALKGRSGSGKTTLINCIGGLDRPTTGRVIFEGKDLNTLSDGELTRLRRERVGFVFQSFALMPLLSAQENVELPLRIAGAPAAERVRRALECLELVGLSKRAHHRPYELSGGEQQRVAIARALAPKPALILADEPTGELDSRTGMQIIVLFRRLVQEQGVTICMTTHDPAVMELADTTFALVDGQVVDEVTAGV